MKPLAVGEVLGDRFELLGELGRGGLATVWLALDRTRGEKVALKILHPHLAADPGARQRLRRELQAAALVRHEAILSAWELHELDGHAALSMPWHRGATLGETVARVGPLPAETVRSLGTQLAEGLSAAHRMGVLHRDISANNVMLDDSGRAALMDFGLARVQHQHSTRHSAALGTAGHTAPEVYDGVRGEARSDLYSLGTVLYLAATGRPAFGGGPPAGILRRQLAGEHLPVAELRPDLPAELAATIEALLQPDPKRRPSGAAEVAELLRAKLAPERPPEPTRAAPPSPAGGRALVHRPELPEGRYVVEVRARKRRPRARPRQPSPGARYAASVANELLRRVNLPTLPEEWVQAVQGPRTPPEVLTRAVAAAAGVPPDALRPGPVLEEPAFRLVAGVSEAVADNLAALADSQGFVARSYAQPPRPEGPTRLLAYAPMLIPVVWLLFAAGISQGLNGILLLPVAVLLTMLLPVLGAEFGGRRKSDKLPLAFARDLTPHLETGWSVGAQGRAVSVGAGSVGAGSVGAGSGGAVPGPTVERAPAQSVPPEPTRAQAALAVALARVERLRAAVEGARLPAAASRDLQDRASELEQQARELARHIEVLEVALRRGPDTAAAAELGRLEERLRRLEVLERAGEPGSAGERAALERSIEALREEQAADEAREGQLTAALAQLAELGATAGAAARRLEERDNTDPTGPAHDATERLARDLATLDQARRELDEDTLRRQRAVASKVRGRL